MLDLRNENLLETIQKGIIERLKDAAINRDLINVNFARGLGKSHALVEFAKQYGFAVIVPNRMFAEDNRYQMNYKNIYGKDQNLQYLNKVVIDEGVSKNDVEKQGCEVITGYYSGNERMIL